MKNKNIYEKINSLKKENIFSEDKKAKKLAVISAKDYLFKKNEKDDL